MEKITVYTTDFCSSCVRVKSLLGQRGFEYEEINLARDPAGRTALVDRTGRMSFPQVLVGETVIGGFEETARAASTGKLADLLAA